MNYSKNFGLVKFLAKYNSVCSCHKNILKGDMIYYDIRNRKAYCPTCTSEIDIRIQRQSNVVLMQYGQNYISEFMK
jgi:hypothetical protein